MAPIEGPFVLRDHRSKMISKISGSGIPSSQSRIGMMSLL